MKADQNFDEYGEYFKKYIIAIMLNRDKKPLSSYLGFTGMR